MDVRLPDGRVVRNVPEGTTKTELMRRVGLADERRESEPPIPEPVNPQVHEQFEPITAGAARSFLGQGLAAGLGDEIEAEFDHSLAMKLTSKR